jgi:hypothetical protein
MSSPPPGRGNTPQSTADLDPLAGRESSPLAFPSSSPQGSPKAGAATANASSQASNHGTPGGPASGSAAAFLRPPQSGNNYAPHSSSPLAFPSSSPQRGTPGSQTATPLAGNSRANNANPLFAPDSATRNGSGGSSLRGSAVRNARSNLATPSSDGGVGGGTPSSEPLFFPSSATPKARRARGDIHSSLPLSPSPSRRRGLNADGTRASGTSTPHGSNAAVTPSLSNVGLSSDALEENERNQGARTVIWNTSVSLDETMSTFKMFLQDFKAKYRTEYARKLGKPLPFVPDPERPVYEH